MNNQELFQSTNELYKKACFQNYDECNGFVFDARGFVRWTSPISDFHPVSKSNKKVESILNSSGIRVIYKNGYLCAPSEKKSSYDMKFLLTLSHDLVDCFGSKERVANDILIYLENTLNITFELRKVSEEIIGSNLSEYTFKVKTGLEKSLVSENFVILLQNSVSSAIKKEFRKTPEFL